MNRHPSIAVVLVLVLASLTSAADPQAPVTAADFPKLYAQWKQHLARFAQLREIYQNDASSDKKALEAEADALAKQVQALMPRLIDSAEKTFVAGPNQNQEVTDFLVAALADYVSSDNYEKAAQLANTLVENKAKSPHIDLLAGVAYFNTNDFDAAQKHLQAAKDANAINRDGLRYLELTDEYKQKWAREKTARDRDAAAANLPKVKLETSQGDIVVALFEEEAPNTVANFITLVEKGYYDGLLFHRVIPGFMAQGGDPNGDGSGGPGYTIPDEVAGDDHREHFRGSLSMAKTAAPDSGGSQFFLCFVPTSHLDGKHTVFGRVIEGMDVLSKLHRTEGTPARLEPDRIIKATVLDKRLHKYQPVTRPDK